MTMLVGALLGTAMGCGAFGALIGWRGVPQRSEVRSLGTRTQRQQHAIAPVLRPIAAIASAAVAIGATGWPVAGFIAGIAGFAMPTAFKAKMDRNREIDRMTALATWIEMVRDTASATSGLIEALKTTAVSAPTVVRVPVRQLAARAERESLPKALAKFAEEMDHAVADSIVATLGLAAANQIGSLQEHLAEIAESTRQEVSMRLRIETSRVRQFTSARFIASIVAIFSAGMVLFSRPYLSPFDTLLGQVILAIIGGLFLGSGIALVRMSRFNSPPRILNLTGTPITIDER